MRSGIERLSGLARRVTLTTVAAACVLATPGEAAAPEAQPLSADAIAQLARRMSGNWQGPPLSEKHETGVRGSAAADLPADADPPAYLLKLLRPWAREIHDVYVQFIDFQRQQSLDVPTPDALCLPFAMPSEGSAAYGFPWQLLVTPNAAIITTQLDGQMRIVRMNQAHTANVAPSWYGDSVGHWDGDTLVIDTIGYNDRSEIQEFPAGWPHTDKVRTEERFRVSDDGKHLEAQWTYEDPGALSGPFVTHKVMDRSDDFQEYVNGENNQEFECPTADKPTSYVPLTLESARAKLRAAQVAAAAKAGK